MPGVLFHASARVHAAVASGQNSAHARFPGASLSAVEGTVTDNHQMDRPERLSVRPEVVEGVRVVRVSGEIDHDVTDVLGRALTSEDGATPPHIVADLSGVTFMDSSGINVLVAAHQRASDAQGWLRIAGAQAPVSRVLHLVGIDLLIPCRPTVEQALRG